MKKNNYILRGAGVLLIGALLICSSVAAITNTNDIIIQKTSDIKINTPISNIELMASDNVLWDNWVESWSGSFAAQLEPPGTPNPLDAFPADDFMFDTDTDVYRVYYGAGYWNCNYAEGPKDYHSDWTVPASHQPLQYITYKIAATANKGQTYKPVNDKQTSRQMLRTKE